MEVDMALDSNIILSGRMPELMNPMDAMGKAMTLKNLSMQGKINQRELEKSDLAYADQKTMRDLTAKHTVANPDGTVALNKGAMLSDLAKVNPSLALTAQKQFETEGVAKQTQDIAQREKLLGVAKDLAWSINDEQSYQQAREMGIKMGLPNADKLPPQYDPNLVKQMQYRTLSAQQQLDQQKQAQDYSLKERELGIKANAAKNKAEYLPAENQITIKDLAKSNASKISISNQIEGAFAGWDQMSDAEKLQQGRQLIKTLNSTQGADAVGSEESKRLAGKLEFAYGNLSNDNPVQFGRDLEGFKKDAELTVQAIRTAVNSNKKEIDRAYGRPSQSKPQSNLVERQTPDGKIALFDPNTKAFVRLK
jgi:hypothetical protein